MSDFVVSRVIGLAALVIVVGGLLAFALAMQIGTQPSFAQQSLFFATLSAFSAGSTSAFWMLRKVISRKSRGSK